MNHLQISHVFGRAKRATGSIDRAHDGLVSGWFCCTRCGEGSDITPDLYLDGAKVGSLAYRVDREDIPCGLGVLFRFNPLRKIVSQVRLQCAVHEGEYIERVVEDCEWETKGIGAVESAVWPVVSGWSVEFEECGVPVFLQIEGCEPIRISSNVDRVDVCRFLGSEGFTGFSANIGELMGFAHEDETEISLVAGGEQLAHNRISGSPLGSKSKICNLTVANSVESGKELPTFQYTVNTAEIAGEIKDWRILLQMTGFDSNGHLQEQMARYLSLRGATVSEIVKVLERKARHALGVPTVSTIRVAEGSQNVSLFKRQLASGDRNLLNSAPHVPPFPDDHLSNEVKNAPLDVMVAGLTRHRSGLGLNARHSLSALREHGVHACEGPFFPAKGGWNRDLGLVDDHVHSLKDHVVLLHIPMDSVVPTLSAQPSLLTSSKLVGFYMWETEMIPLLLRRALDVVDEVWTASEFVASAFRSWTNTPVQVVGHAVSVSDVELLKREEFGLADNEFVVHFAFDANSTVARKNPGAAIRSFQHAFPGDITAKFLLKVRNWSQVEGLAASGEAHAQELLSLLAKDPRIKLVTGEKTHAQALGLIAMSDCYISLHRSEGFGYGIAEAMALEVPVIATAYSGSMDLTTHECAWLVPYSKIDVLPGEYFYWEEGMFWADADIDAAAEALREIRSRGQLVELRVQAARIRVSELTSLERLGDRYVSALSP